MREPGKAGDECADTGIRKLVEAWIRDEKQKLTSWQKFKVAATTATTARLLDSPAA